MSKRHFYNKSPIVEAVIDFRIKPSVDSSMDKIKSFCSDIQSKFPTHAGHVASVTMQFDGLGGGGPAITHGYVVRNDTNTQVIQARMDGFSFSQLAPYSRWEDFREEVQSVWTNYRSTINPDSIERLALRYLNRFELPQNLELKDYLNLYPELRAPMPQGLDGFFIRVQLTHHDIEAVSLLNQSNTPTKTLGTVGILLDLDLFRTKNLPQGDLELWNLLELMHSKQNELFESCITEQTRGLIA